MSKHNLFLVHGMGDFNDGWSAPVQELLRTTYAGYERSGGETFDDLFDVHEINYNRFFEERRDAWRNRTEEINALLLANGFDVDAVDKLMDLANAADGDDFFRTHVLDVIMYRFMPQIAEQVRRHVQLKILEVLSAGPENRAVAWSVVAHSLGTSVVHDTLHAMFTHAVDGVRLSRTDRLQVLCMVANVSRLLWNDIDFFGTAVKPHPLPSKGLCQQYLNAQHGLDPFPRVKSFHRPPPDWLDDAATAEKSYRYLKIPNEEITDWNVHGFAHYLANPRVHVPLFRALLFDALVAAREEKALREAYAKKTLPAAARNNAIAELEAFEPGKLENWKEVTEAITAFRSLVIKKGIAAAEGENQ